jgi:hypothetical protein
LSGQTQNLSGCDGRSKSSWSLKTLELPFIPIGFAIAASRNMLT